LAWTFIACTHTLPGGKSVDYLPNIFPDYAETTIPPNIAPLNFALTAPDGEAYAAFAFNEQTFVVKAKNGQFTLPAARWKKLLNVATGNSITVTICEKKEEWLMYAPFHIHVAEEPIDPYVAYRLIEPGYALWNSMGIYQRNLENFLESAIIENKMTRNNCMNCHSFCMQDPTRMLFHIRETYPGTLLINGDKIEKLNAKTEQIISSLVYPSWHPSGRYVAFSVNKIMQSYHINHPNRIEVYDEASDVVVYDIEKHEIVTTAALFSEKDFETFPTFSPDGKTLYFCSAVARPMPHAFEEVKYSLCAITFDPETRRFGAVTDTLFHAPSQGKSVSFPRVSPDGNHLIYTLSEYGNFSIWHKDADLYIRNLATNENRPLEILNSGDVESYHSWSSNSRWLIFSSRRIDGLYTRLYIAHIDAEGNESKPFLLPQKDTGFYHRFMKSYNIPEFITGKVKNRSYELAQKVRKKGTQVKFVAE
jgi:hypothetical protein